MRTGYRNLIQLVSKGYLEGFYYKPRIDLDLLRKHSEGLIATSGCLSSMVCRAITAGQTRTAWQRVEELSGIFPGRFYLELQRHGIGAQDRVNAELSKMAIDLGLPLLATNDAHYLEHGDHRHHEALLCIGTGTNLDDPKRFRFDGEGFYLKSGDEMAELFHDHPSAIRNTLELAERCELDLELDSGSYHLPEFQVPSNTTREAVLEEQTGLGLRERLGLAPDEPIPPRWGEYAKRIETELAVINSMGFAGYFLIVSDFIAYARRNGIPVGPGRGSSAGSLVAYCLGITGIDPIEYDIIFERFLNPERISMPDIDVDFCMRGRDQVIRYVAEKYDGEGFDGKRVAQIITFGKLQARAAIRDVGRVLGMPYGEVDRLAKLIPETLGIIARRGDRAVARAALAHRGRWPGRAADRDGAAPRGPHAPRLDARRRRRDRNPAADRDGAAVSRPEVRRRDDAVRHALRREGRADQVRLPRAAHAHHDRRRRSAHPRGGRAGLRDREDPARRREDLRAARRRRFRGRVPDRVRRHDRAHRRSCGRGPSRS